MLKHADRSPIKSILVGGYWDGPLNGWLRVAGHYYYFESIEEGVAHWHRLYMVYWVDKEHRIPYLLRKRQFRHMVGWHQVRYPGKDRTFFTGDRHSESFKTFYELPRLPKLDDTKMKLVGITDLDEEVIWLYNKKDFDREWEYIEYVNEEEESDR